MMWWWIRGVWEKILSWAIHECIHSVQQQHTIIILALLSVKSMICVQLKIHQLGRQHEFGLQQRSNLYQEWAATTALSPFAVTQLNSKTPPLHIQNLLSASQETSLWSTIFCVPIHLLGRKARDTSSSPAGMTVMKKCLRLLIKNEVLSLQLVFIFWI